MGLATHAACAATRAVLRSYVRTWAAEFKDTGIGANTLSPGVIDTPMRDSKATTQEGRAAIRQGYAAHTPMPRLGRPKAKAAASLFLTAAESAFMTGSDIVADGGVSDV